MTSFFIAVPTFNSAEYLGHSLASLLDGQPGEFDLHVRVQDGGSSDGTVAVAEEWARRVASGGVPNATRRRLSIVSAEDAGLYDAVAAAFDSVAGEAPDVLTWLGSDDLLMAGALATVANVFERFPRIRWLTGQPQVVDGQGAWYTGWSLAGFARRNLRRGLHEGRGLPFVMQEGTFWRSSLYREAGGLRRDLRLAGDFDLWRRFARTDDLVMCSFPLGAWRHRSGQASGDKAGYYREVDRVLGEDRLPAIEEEAAGGDAALRFRPVVLDRYFGRDYALRVEGLPFYPLEGFGPQEWPAPGHELHASFIRMVAPAATLKVPILEQGVPYRIALRFRNAHPDQWLTIRAGGALLHDAAVRCCDADAPQVVTFTCTPETAEPVLTISCRSGAARPARRTLIDRLRGRRPAPAEAAGGLLVEDVAFERMVAGGAADLAEGAPWRAAGGRG
jgi:glycosyltransferase involved in cell wall biosynthesis